MWRSQIGVVVCFETHTNIFSERNQTSLSIFENCQCIFMSLARGALRPGRKGGTQPLIYFGTQICRWTSAWTYNYVKQTWKLSSLLSRSVPTCSTVDGDFSLAARTLFLWKWSLLLSNTKFAALQHHTNIYISTPVRCLFSETQTQALHSDGQRASHEDL